MIIDEITDGLNPMQKKYLADRLAGSTLVRVQNVADYYMYGTDQEFWSVKDFPNCRPPWNSTWWEWRLPRVSRSSVYGVKHHEPAVCAVYTSVLAETKMGIVLAGDVFCRAHFTPDPYLGTFLRIISPEGQLITGEEPEEKNHPLILQVRQWLDDNKISAEKPLPLPQVIDQRCPGLFFIPAKEYAINKIVADGIGKLANGLEKIVWLAISFAHCKNVEIVSEPTAPALVRRRQQKQRFPVLRTTTISIEPLKKIIREMQHSAGGISASKALHMVRGHFKTYTAEKPLLGHVTGTFFWHQQLRGTKAIGEVIKDYEVKR